ncbi:MAG: hypothetical protein ACRDOD_17030 [Streptosporangiaceae bacterium]
MAVLLARASGTGRAVPRFCRAGAQLCAALCGADGVDQVAELRFEPAVVDLCGLLADDFVDDLVQVGGADAVLPREGEELPQFWVVVAPWRRHLAHPPLVLDGHRAGPAG